jgi:hypothetical protein
MKIKNKDVQKRIDSWYNNIQFEVIHYWDQDETWFVIIHHYSPSEDETKLDFVRIFPSYRIEGEYHLSVDKTVNV